GWLFRPWSYVLKEESKNWSEWVPTKETNTNGFEYFGDTLMEVSINKRTWYPRVVFGKKKGHYVAWLNAETLGKAEDAYSSTEWRYARPIKTKLTLKQIAEKFGLKEHEIEIID